MSTSGPDPDPRALRVVVGEHELTVELADGRRSNVPLVRFPRLLHASPQQRQNWRLLGEGRGIHWPDVDEDVWVEGLLPGGDAPQR